MAVPDFQTMMLPLLRVAQDQSEHSLRETAVLLAKLFNLSESEIEERIPSGLQTKFNNRISWVCTHFKKAKLLEYTKRGHFKITSRGIDLLNQGLNKIDLKTLQQYPEFIEFRTVKQKKNTNETLEETVIETYKTPEELLEASFQTIRNALANEIIEKVKSCPPSFFEYLVVDLLVRMGYGGTREDAGERLGRSGDGGIDGIIKEDRLGLDVIYLQAKRWEGVVGRPEIQKFAGALQGQRARKGVFITTSDFTKEAREYVSLIDSKIILIGGEELAELMIDYNVGVSNATIYEIKKVDSDYFVEE